MSKPGESLSGYNRTQTALEKAEAALAKDPTNPQLQANVAAAKRARTAATEQVTHETMGGWKGSF